MPECASKDPASKTDNVFRFLLHTSPVLCQSLRITITVSRQIRTIQYHSIPFYTIQYHANRYNTMHLQAYLRSQNVILYFCWANQAQKLFHYPTRYYSTTRLLSSLPYPTLPYSKLKNYYSLGPKELLRS